MTPSTIFLCYSDASIKDGIAAYASTVIEVDERGSRERKFIGRLDTDDSNAAEILAIARTIERAVPDNAVGVFHTDLYHIHSHLNSCNSTLAESVWKLKLELVRTGMRILYVPASLRSPYYRECHNRANIARRCKLALPSMAISGECHD